MALENPTALLSPTATPPTVRWCRRQCHAGQGQTEASKTEPDKNTYLVLEDQKGPDAGYNYGTHFLFQGHEDGPKPTTEGRRAT